MSNLRSFCWTARRLGLNPSPADRASTDCFLHRAEKHYVHQLAVIEPLQQHWNQQRPVFIAFQGKCHHTCQNIDQQKSQKEENGARQVAFGMNGRDLAGEDDGAKATVVGTLVASPPISCRLRITRTWKLTNATSWDRTRISTVASPAFASAHRRCDSDMPHSVTRQAVRMTACAFQSVTARARGLSLTV